MAKKRGSNIKATCQLCGKVLTKAGLIGHMAWSHGKHHKAPMLPSKARPEGEIRRKADLIDSFVSDIVGHEKDGRPVDGYLYGFLCDRCAEKLGCSHDKANEIIAQRLYDFSHKAYADLADSIKGARQRQE